MYKKIKTIRYSNNLINILQLYNYNHHSPSDENSKNFTVLISNYMYLNELFVSTVVLLNLVYDKVQVIAKVCFIINIVNMHIIHNYFSTRFKEVQNIK